MRIRKSPTTTAVLTTFRERGRCLGEVEQSEDLIAWISVRSTHHQSPRGRDVTENGRQVTSNDQNLWMALGLVT